MSASLVDYPLRTTALACLFALACGVMVAPAFDRSPLAIDTPHG